MSALQEKVKVTIKHAAFTYKQEVPDPMRQGEFIFAERVAYQGQEVELEFQDDYVRGEKFHAFVREGEKVPTGEGKFDPGPDETWSSVDELSDVELMEWIKVERPRVQETIDAAEGDSEAAKRLLKAEEDATGGDPRRGVVIGLTAIIGNA